MKLSHSLIATKRTNAHNAETPGHGLLLRAGYIQQMGAGLYSLLPLGIQSIRKIESLLRAEMHNIGAQEVSVPIVQPAEAWIQTGRYESIGAELVRFADRFNRPMVLALTSEELIATTVKKLVTSYRQLPTSVFQIQTKFRDEIRPRMGLIRAREFIMKDSYSFDLDLAGLNRSYEAHFAAYRRIFEKIGLRNVLAVKSDTGTMGGTIAHEFMYPSEHGEDTIGLCNVCGLGVNAILLAERAACPACESTMSYARAVEVRNIFQLGDFYTKAIGFSLTTQAGESINPLMGSYGIGVGRVLGCLAEEYHDERGLCLPPQVAPFTGVLLQLSREAKSAQIACDIAYEQLTAAGISVLYDDRDASPGVKFADADLLGLPFRLTVSQRSLREGGIEITERATGETHVTSIGNIVSYLAALA